MDDIGVGAGVARAGCGRPTRPEMGAALAATALLIAIAFRRGRTVMNADALLYGLISTEQLTPFYWGQDRLASVVAATAWPVQDLRSNYLLQTAILAASFFALIGSFVWFHLVRSGRDPSWPRIVASATATGLLALTVLTPSGTYTFVIEQQYALSTLLYLAGLSLLSSRRAPMSIAGTAGVLVAALIIPSVVLLWPAAFVMQKRSRPLVPVAGAGIVSCCALVVSVTVSRLFGDDGPSTDAYSDFSLARVRAGVETAANSILDSVDRWRAVPLGLACLVVLVLRRRAFDRSLRHAYLLAPVLAAGWLVLFSANRWVEINLHLYRYFFPVHAMGLMILSGAVSEVTGWIADHRGQLIGAKVGPTASITLAAAAVVAAGALLVTTKVPVVEAGERLFELTEREEIDVLAGDYWQVWPATFVARDNDADLLPATVRAGVFRERILQLASVQRPLRVMCVGVDQAGCVAELTSTTARQWRVVEAHQDDPLILEVELLPTSDPSAAAHRSGVESDGLAPRATASYTSRSRRSTASMVYRSSNAVRAA
jgi:hypothetical protein